MSRSIREQIVDDMPMQDDKPEPIDDAEICRRCGELSTRLKQTVESISKKDHPATASDVATMTDVIDFLDQLVNSKAAEESLRLGGVLAIKDGKALAEWVDDDRSTAPHRRELREWMRKA
jgi:hypothetical protein